jgi:hypothetical protein
MAASITWMSSIPARNGLTLDWRRGWRDTDDDHRCQERDPSAPVKGMDGAASADHFG